MQKQKWRDEQQARKDRGRPDLVRTTACGSQSLHCIPAIRELGALVVARRDVPPLAPNLPSQRVWIICTGSMQVNLSPHLDLYTMRGSEGMGWDLYELLT